MPETIEVGIPDPTIPDDPSELNADSPELAALIEPQAEAVETIVAAAAQPPITEKVYTHTHNDGHEFSGTAAQAAKLCPVLGRMSIKERETALQQQDLASKIAERGRQRRMKAEAAKKA